MSENKKDEKALKKVKQDGGKKQGFMNVLKKRWLISKTSTILLIAILIAAFILINMVVKKIDFTPIDCTKSQDFSLTDESKERVKNIDKDINIYFVGYDDTNQDYSLAKQYNKVNSKINVELVDSTNNPELKKKYDLTDNTKTVIVECGDKSRTLTQYDLVSYDDSYNTVDIAEQKITSAIINVTSDKTPKVYFLTGYTNFSLTNTSGGLQLLSQYLKDEVLTTEELNILSTGKVPDDCDALMIMTPEKDFDKSVADAIIDYINKGGKILWLNGAYIDQAELPNVNRVLAQYGINGFSNGYVYDTNTKNTIMGYPACFMPRVQETDITKDVYNGAGVIFLYPTKINIDKDKLTDLKVTETDLVMTDDTACFTTDVTGSSVGSGKDEKGTYTLGAEMVKRIKGEDKDEDKVDSELIIYGNDYFISDQGLSDSSGNQYNMIYLANNADLGLNSLAHLTEIDQDITIRKSYSDSVTSFTPTDGEKKNIIAIIFLVPLAIIIIGIVIWVLRKRKK